MILSVRVECSCSCSSVTVSPAVVTVFNVVSCSCCKVSVRCYSVPVVMFDVANITEEESAIIYLRLMI